MSNEEILHEQDEIFEFDIDDNNDNVDTPKTNTTNTPFSVSNSEPNHTAFDSKWIRPQIATKTMSDESKGYKHSDNAWLPILICGYMKVIGEILKSPDKAFIATVIPQSVIDICETYSKPKLFNVGDTMILQNGIGGKIEYIGIPPFKKFYNNQYKPQEIIGINTDKWYVNLGTGTIDDIEYFTAKPGHAYFIESVKIWRYYDMVETKTNWGRSTWKCEKVRRDYEIDKKLDAKEIKVGDRVKYKNGLVGDVIFIGDVELESYWETKVMKNTLGLELIDWSANAMSDGYINGTWYLPKEREGTTGRIYFVTCKGIVRNYSVE